MKKIKNERKSPLEEVRKKKPLLGRGWGGSSPSLGGVGEASAFKILVIQQKMIGDVLVSSLICENLKLNYPKAEVHYLVNRFTIPVIENNPYIDEIVVFEDEYRSSKLEFFKFLKSIRKANYDVVIDAYGKLESNLITLFSRAKIKISWGKKYSHFLYSDVFKNLKQSKTNAGLAIEDRLNLLNPLKLKLPLQNSPKIYLMESEKNKAKMIFKKHHLDFSTPIFMISVLGSAPSKTYPFIYMAQILNYITQNSEAELIFNYAPHQKKQAKTIYNLCHLSTQKRIHFDLSPSTLREFMSITSFCDALIGNEGGAVNMAKAIGVPTFTIYSPWIDKKAWASFEDSDYHKSIHLEDIKPEYYKKSNYKDLKGKSIDLYLELSTSYVIEKLETFLYKILH